MHTPIRLSVAAVLLATTSMWASVAAAAGPGPAALASSLQSDPVQSIDVPRSSFSALSAAEINSLRAEIARVDPGRIWIVVVSPRSQSSLANLADPVFADLPAGTLISVAEDRSNPNSTNFWIGSSLESSDRAQTQLNNVIQGYRKGQGSLFDDLRLEIQSFARTDAAAGHPALSSTGNSGQPQATSRGGGTSVGLIAVAIVGALVLLAGAIFGGRYARGALRSSHRRHEESADAHERAKADFGKLGDGIEALDIDSSMASASPAGKDEYAKALDCYEEAERRMRQSDDEYQFEQALGAIARGLEHLHNADRLFNPTRDARDAPVKSTPNPDGTGAATGERRDVVDQLADLTALHDRGALTDAEFNEQKSKLLGT